jgi:hypothetical protein
MSKKQKNLWDSTLADSSPYTDDKYIKDSFAETVYKAAKYVPRCYETHPPLPVGKDLVIYGGNCGYPVVKDADIYIGFDGCMNLHTPYPWAKQDTPLAIEIYFPISDGSVPKDEYNFRQMVVWTAEQIRAGKKVHAGCIGGHGRTGLFFSALVNHMLGEKDATTYVRSFYCKKAVENKTQVNWLFDTFGITKTTGSKDHLSSTFGFNSKGQAEFKPTTSHGKSGTTYTNTDTFKSASGKSITPVPSKKSIWGAGAVR